MKIVFWLLAASTLHAQVISGWAFGGPDHRLHAIPDSHGNTIMDFSAAGYRGGGVKLPSAAAAQRLTPVDGDNTARIQAALDNATGAVVLAAGEYEIAGTLSIKHSGVVLRGERGAHIKLTGKLHAFLEILGTGTWHEEGPPAPVLDAYVPAGARTFRVRGGSNLSPGDHVLVLRPVTTEWLHLMGMDPLIHGREFQTPLRAGSVIHTDRVIESVEGDGVTLDVPLSDALDARLTAASLVHYSFPGRIREVGVEGLRIVEQLNRTADPNPQSAPLIKMDAVEDGWARDLDIEDTQDGFAIGPTAKRLTLTNIQIKHSAAQPESTTAADFALQGTQILLDRCRVTGGSTRPLTTEGAVTGPVAVLNFTADHGGFAPGQGWTTGLLVDGGEFQGGTERSPGLGFYNCAPTGSEHGSGIGWAVAWNVRSTFLLIQQPPATLNWCIGCVGTPVTIGSTPTGIFDSLGTMVGPSSLYLQQLRDRLGPDALENIGYSERTVKLL
jgi:hypothetical protein